MTHPARLPPANPNQIHSTHDVAFGEDPQSLSPLSTATIPTLWAAIIRHAAATVVSRCSMKRKPFRMMCGKASSWRTQTNPVAAAVCEADHTLERCRRSGWHGRRCHGAPINWAPTRCAIALAIGQGA